jgi:hypothetical protein
MSLFELTEARVIFMIGTLVGLVIFGLIYLWFRHMKIGGAAVGETLAWIMKNGTPAENEAWREAFNAITNHRPILHSHRVILEKMRSRMPADCAAAVATILDMV